jgi:hypothetical protein
MNELKSNPSWSSRMDAAIALRNFPSPVSVAALLDALDDSEKLVRHHAAASLLALYGHDPDPYVNNPHGLPIRVMRDFEHAAAVAELHRIVQEGTLQALHK